KLRASERSIEIGKAIVEADGVVDVLPAVRHLGLGAHVLRSRSQLFVIDDDGTPASRGDRLVAVEAERANTPDSARVTAFVVRPDAFRGVLNEHDSVSLAYLDQRVEVAREPVRVDAERLLARVHEMRNRPAVRDRVWGCHEGEGRGEHLVTGRH